MGDFAEAVLQKIKESEVIAVEKHGKLRSYEVQVEELKRTLEEHDRNVEQVKERVVLAKSALQSRKVDLAQYNICHDSMKQQADALSEKITAATTGREDKVQEMTDLVDKIARDTRQVVTSYGLMASEEATRKRRNSVRNDLVSELDVARKLYEEVNRMEEAIDKNKKISSEVDQLRKELSEAKELRKNLENQASELMTTVSNLSMKRQEGRNISKTAREVKELQMEVSKLMQEGRLGGVDQELLEGRFKADVAVEKLEENSVEDNVESDSSEYFFSGERVGDGVGVRKQGARFSFSKY